MTDTNSAMKEECLIFKGHNIAKLHPACPRIKTEAGILLPASVFDKRKPLKINTFEKDVQKDEKSD